MGKFKMKGFTPFTKNDDDDKPLGDIVIVDDNSNKSDTTKTTTEDVVVNGDDDCPTGTCPPPKPAFGTKEHRDMVKKQFQYR